MRLAVCAVGLLSVLVMSCGTATSTPAQMPAATPRAQPTATPTPRPAELILGKWQQVNATETYEFFPDGTALKVQVGLFGPDDVDGTYRFQDVDHVRIEWVGAWASEVLHADVSFRGDRMLLSWSTGGATECQRVR